MSWHPVTPTIPHREVPCQGWERGGPRPRRVKGEEEPVKAQPGTDPSPGRRSQRTDTTAIRDALRRSAVAPRRARGPRGSVPLNVENAGRCLRFALRTSVLVAPEVLGPRRTRPNHSITLSARVRTDGGIVRPISRAVRRLRANSILS